MSVSFSAQAEAMPQAPSLDNPLPEIWIGAIVAVAFFGGILGWAAVAPLDAAAQAQGVLSISGLRQSVQHREGGVVSGLFVREGDQVTAGQPLISLASQEIEASERSLAARVVARKVEIARLQAELSGQPLISPIEFATWTGAEKDIAERAIVLAQKQLHAQRSANATRRGILLQRIDEDEKQIDGALIQAQSNRTQQKLNADELKGMQALANQGYAPITRVRELQKGAASLEGDAGARGAQIAGLRSSQGEARLEISKGDSDRLQEVGEQLRLAHADLQSLEPQWIAARSQLDRMTLRAPVSGAVINLTVNTVGGVVTPAQTVMSIVPKAGDMVVEAKFAPQDIDGLRVGKSAQIRFPSLHDRQVPLINGTLTRISADTLTDERTGRTYYTGQVTVPQFELRKIREASNDHTLRAGEPVDVVVRLHSRTALQYLLQPITGFFWKSLRER
jgi:HlyD family type I secretion membrane fusion protein